SPRRRSFWLALFLPLLRIAFEHPAPRDDAPDTTGALAAEVLPVPDAALAVIDSTDLRGHIAVLASDEFEGRGTGTPGEERTVEYIREQMQAIGLVGAAPDGGFFQEVPLLGSTPVDV